MTSGRVSRSCLATASPMIPAPTTPTRVSPVTRSRVRRGPPRGRRNDRRLPNRGGAAAQLPGRHLEYATAPGAGRRRAPASGRDRGYGPSTPPTTPHSWDRVPVRRRRRGPHAHFTRRSEPSADRRRPPSLDDAEVDRPRPLVARRQLPVRRPDLPAGQPAAASAPLAPEDIKPRLLGHWGTTPGLNLVYDPPQPADPRARRRRDLPGRARATAARRRWPTPGWRAPTARSTRTSADDADGMRELFRQFSFPGGIPSHVAPETPGSIHEGGELGYVLSHAYGAAMDNPDLLVAAVVGDGEFETGPLAASWHANKFVDPVHDGAVLPILHLNGYKIANPTVPARIPRDGAREPAARLRPRGAHRRGRRPGRRAPAAGRGAGRGARPDPRDPARRPRGRRPRAPAVADDPAASPPRAGPARPRSTASRSRAPGGPTRCRWPATRDERRAPARSSRSGCAPTGPRSSSTTTAGRSPELRGAGARRAPAG